MIMYNAQYSLQVLHIHDQLKHDICKGVVQATYVQKVVYIQNY